MQILQIFSTFSFSVFSSPPQKRIFLLQIFVSLSSIPKKKIRLQIFLSSSVTVFIFSTKKISLFQILSWHSFLRLLDKKYFLTLSFFFSYRVKIITPKLSLLSTCIACFLGWAMNLKGLFIGITPTNLPARYQSTYSLKAKKLWKVWEPKRGGYGEGVV